MTSYDDSSNSSPVKGSSGVVKKMVCHYCGRVGHIKGKCFKMRHDKKGNSKPILTPPAPITCATKKTESLAAESVGDMQLEGEESRKRKHENTENTDILTNCNNKKKNVSGSSGVVKKMVCHYCGRVGHVKGKCFKMRRDKKGNSKPILTPPAPITCATRKTESLAAESVGDMQLEGVVSKIEEM